MKTIRAQAPRAGKYALAFAAAAPRYQRPTACLTCGGELAPSKPAFCSIGCAQAARTRKVG